MNDLPPVRVWVELYTPGFSARWCDTPERIQKLLAFASECIVSANVEAVAERKLSEAARLQAAELARE